MTEYYPWLPYLAIPAFTNLLHSDCRYFEWGAGASTLYAARLKAKIWSVEHDLRWFRFTADRLPDDDLSEITLFYREIFAGYVPAIDEVVGDFDLILVDGRQRVECCLKAAKRVAAGGTIVLDNSDRKKYEEGRKFLKAQGFEEKLYFSVGQNKKPEPWQCSFFTSQE